MSILSGPIFEPSEWGYWKSNFGEQGAHYNIFHLKNNKNGIKALRNFFPRAKADELNFCLFSTSGVHGIYNTIEEANKHLKDPIEDETVNMITFLIVQSRIVCLRYGNCYPENEDDIEFLEKLRQSSFDAILRIGI